MGTLFRKGRKEKLVIVYKVRLEVLVSETNEYRINEFIKRRVKPIYKEYPYAQVRIEVIC